MFRDPIRRKRRSVSAATAALALLLSGCGGTRMSDEAIERAAGIGQSVSAQVPAASAGALADPGLPAAGPVTAPAAVAAPLTAPAAPVASTPSAVKATSNGGAVNAA